MARCFPWMFGETQAPNIFENLMKTACSAKKTEHTPSKWLKEIKAKKKKKDGKLNRK